MNDSICGTWEKLADAVCVGGAAKLKSRGFQAVGAEKFTWAEAIPPHMELTQNLSHSFCYFRDKLQELVLES